VNRRAARQDPPVPAEPAAAAVIDALAVLRASDEEVLARWGRWYIAERDPRYLRRNALIVVGNTADPADPAVLTVVEEALRSPDALLRAHAVWAAVRLGRADLLAGLTGAGDPLVATELAATGSVARRSDAAAESVRFLRSRPGPPPTRPAYL
jgi:epoxyqueuosine reductase